jgi:hypothetical protein
MGGREREEIGEAYIAQASIVTNATHDASQLHPQCCELGVALLFSHAERLFVALSMSILAQSLAPLCPTAATTAPPSATAPPRRSFF